MTTYTITGTVIYTDFFTDEFVSSDATGATLEIVVPDSVSTFEYSLLPPMYDNPIGEAVIDVQDYNIRINGMTLSDQFTSDGALLAEIQWVNSGQARKTVVFDLLFFDVQGTGLGRVDGEYIFEITGNALPTIGGAAAYENFFKKVRGIEEAAAPYAPDQDIALDSLGSVFVTENDVIVGTFRGDEYRAGRGADNVSGMAGDDRLFGEKGNDQLKGGSGNDLVNGGVGNDKITGNYGHDTLIGGAGKDTMIGGRGRDILSGKKGNDVMTGGAGRDTFVFDSGKDKITDFDNDFLHLDDALWGEQSLTRKQIMKFAEVSGENLVFSFDSGETLTMVGYNDASALQSLISVF